ncbi:MAG: hypothetical protein ACK5W9_07510 [Bdellovibrionales bacterium]
MLRFIFFLAILVLTGLLGCKKADPNAYTNDPILKDYQSQLQATQTMLEDSKKKLEEEEKELRNSPPQSGQAAVHRKKREEQVDRLSKLTQQATYWQVRIESRAKEAQLEYLKYFKEGKTWPDENAVSSYHAQKRLRLNKLQWDQKTRISEMKEMNNQKSTTKGN